MAFRPVQPQDCLPRFLPAAGPLCLPGLCPAGVKEHYCCQPGDNRRGLALLSIFGVQATYGVELFGIQHRQSRMAVAKELGSILSSGTAPMVASKLLTTFSSWTPLAVYCCLMASIGLNDILRS